MDLSELLFRIKLISAILSVAFGALAVYFIVQFQKLVGIKIKNMLAALRTPETASSVASQSRWGEIIRHLESSKESDWKLAVIEADKLLDNFLKSSGYFGDTMGERLMNIKKEELLSIDGLWEAHKVRNKLVHDVNYFLRYAEARRAIDLYEKALQELEVVS